MMTGMVLCFNPHGTYWLVGNITVGASTVRVDETEAPLRDVSAILKLEEEGGQRVYKYIPITHLVCQG